MIIAREIIETENTSAEDDSTEKPTNVACVGDDGTTQIQMKKSTVKVNCIEGKKCDLLALIDSGSPVSFIQRSVCKLLFGSDFPYNAVTVQRTLNALQIKVIGQKDIGIRLAELSETSNRVTFNIIDTNHWFAHLILGTDFLLKNDLTLTLKKKSKNNLKLINEVASADIIEIDDSPIAVSEIKTDFGHDVDK